MYYAYKAYNEETPDEPLNSTSAEIQELKNEIKKLRKEQGKFPKWAKSLLIFLFFAPMFILVPKNMSVLYWITTNPLDAIAAVINFYLNLF